jgi:hypothetical protein
MRTLIWKFILLVVDHFIYLLLFMFCFVLFFMLRFMVGFCCALVEFLQSGALIPRRNTGHHCEGRGFLL